MGTWSVVERTWCSIKNRICCRTCWKFKNSWRSEIERRKKRREGKRMREFDNSLLHFDSATNHCSFQKIIHKYRTYIYMLIFITRQTHSLIEFWKIWEAKLDLDISSYCWVLAAKIEVIPKVWLHSAASQNLTLSNWMNINFFCLWCWPTYACCLH